VYLLACAIADTLDDVLLATQYDLTRAASIVPFAGIAARAIACGGRVSQARRNVRLADVRRWRTEWTREVDAYLRAFVAADNARIPHGTMLRLAELLDTFPRQPGPRRVRIPAAYRTQDLTHVDVIALARRLSDAFPDRRQPIVIVGLRTAGSYFAPLIAAWLAHVGYRAARWVTIRPKRGIAPWERTALTAVAREEGVAAIVDEAPNTGSTVAKAVGLIHACGFASSRQALLLPIHPTRPDWAHGPERLALRDVRILTLEPDAWHKAQCLDPDVAESRLAEYFGGHGYQHVTVVPGAAAMFNQELQRLSEEKFHTRLKRVYEVRLCDRSGRVETRHVIAKSVGWGWLSYHAFVAAQRLSRFVPPVLGLRDGVLYTEWIPSGGPIDAVPRHRVVNTIASYTARRVTRLGFACDPSRELADLDQHKGSALLAEALAKAFGWKVAALLRRPRVRREIARQSCPRPTLVDGKMRPQEWVVRNGELAKTDFEHHGFGKTELNVADPAFDLADAILHFELSEDEEHALIRRYSAECGDSHVARRLFLQKLLAGAWSMQAALDNVADARLADRHHDFNEQYLRARNFLTIQTTRECAGRCEPPQTRAWGSPVVVLDIDGVLDRQIFGFPSTTAAGIDAVSRLHRHGHAVALDTARTLTEVKEYCRAYGFVGGVAEYGGVVWDAVSGRERGLVGDESRAQLDRTRAALRRIPGVFLDDAYRYSIRAYTFERGTTVPLPTILVRNLLAGVGAGRLVFHQTFVDSTILPREIDKGRGLKALLALAGQDASETIAIGDSEADLAMFHVAGRSYAPSHITCRSLARLLGCRIMGGPFQLGLAGAVDAIVHGGGARCGICPRRAGSRRAAADDLFARLLHAADQPRWRLLAGALIDPSAVQTFAR
jgi:haloacid dehalogenase-like hydrolase